MSLFAKATQQDGAVYVEAAIILPVLLLVTFASSFFFLVAARHFSLQMLANEIAKDVSLILQPVNSSPPAACIPLCMASQGTTFRSNGFENSKSVAAYSTTQMSSNGCWNICARDRYMLATPASLATYPLSLTVTVHPTMQYYDETLPANSSTWVSAGDFFEVSIAYPLRSVWGGGIAFFGIVPVSSMIYGNAVGIIDKRENP
jgi:Flp pilus assembly protein TadG